MSRIKDFVQVLEAWLPSPNDTVQLEEWSKTADYIAYTYEFSEYEQIYVDTLLDMYEEQFREIISTASNASNASNTLSKVLKNGSLNNVIIVLFFLFYILLIFYFTNCKPNV